jgi:hypothetical protein
MLLETSDIKKNDVLIFSGNKFDLESNFKIIFKKNPLKKTENISFYEIGKYINLPVPKNLIVYRLLTNHSPFNANITKFGFLISIEGAVELIYFDPVFALKDIELISKSLNLENFRFKIQQVGLTSLSKKGKTLDFTEIFAFDLKADEAIYQNDRVYAEAIFAFDISFPSDEEYLKENLQLLKDDNQNPIIITNESFVRAKIDLKEKKINELKMHSEKENLIPDKKNKGHQDSVDDALKENKTLQNYIEEQTTIHEKIGQYRNSGADSVINKDPKSTISDFLRRSKTGIVNDDKELNLSNEENKFMNLFKSTSNLGNYLRERAKESFILKIER